MQKIYENQKFSLYTGPGNKYMGLMSFCIDDGTGRAICDTFSVSSADCTLSDFSGKVRKFAAWEDIGKGHTLPGTKAMIWDEPCQHWCACVDGRAARDAKIDYIITGKVYTPKKGTDVLIKATAGDYIAVVQGKISIAGGQTEENLFVTEILEGKTLTVHAVTDSVIFVITATAV